LARRYASLGALSSAVGDAPISAFERFAAERGFRPRPARPLNARRRLAQRRSAAHSSSAQRIDCGAGI